MRKLAILLSLLLLFSLSAGVSAKPTLVNINKADAAALQQSLIGIGPTRAEAIVKYRKKNGKFSSTSELTKVHGLGEKLVKKNKRYLSTSKGLTRGDAKKYQAAKKAAANSRSSTRRTSTRKKTTRSRTSSTPKKRTTRRSTSTSSKKPSSSRATTKKKTTKKKK